MAEDWSTVTISQEMKEELQTLKGEDETWDDLFSRLVTMADLDGHDTSHTQPAVALAEIQTLRGQLDDLSEQLSSSKVEDPSPSMENIIADVETAAYNGAKQAIDDRRH
ncbi:DUF7557 family protein [Natrialba sp. SSL1]|uniref:DUF7557 family protein n=1 Tax=Natrialba sp. SSL1 TaxID=1869245 RepID=UPI00111466AE|nr:hypothetical protein [Natrialba sp. SSL1]